jgi:hypothetical protein
MKHGVLAVAALTIAIGSGSATAFARGATAAGELEHARANARAGGPTNERDAELLERHGCLSGTRCSFCKRLKYRSQYRDDNRYDRRR